MNFLKLIALAVTLFLAQSASAETQQWSCAKAAKDIPTGYYVKAASIVHNDVECKFEEHKVLLAKLEGQPTVLACDFQGSGIPAGYILRARGISQQCGCVTLMYKPSGGRFCLDGKMADVLDVRKQ